MLVAYQDNDYSLFSIISNILNEKYDYKIT